MSENIVRTFRYASREDTALILEFIRGLAEHEHMLDDVVATEELLEEWIFDKGKAEVIYASREDTALILEFIRGLAEHEHMLDDVVATEELLEEWIFDKGKAEVIFVMEDDAEVGFALFFHNFSTFLGRAGVYLEDLFVKPEFRGRGHGDLSGAAWTGTSRASIFTCRLEPSRCPTGRSTALQATPSPTSQGKTSPVRRAREGRPPASPFRPGGHRTSTVGIRRSALYVMPDNVSEFGSML